MVADFAEHGISKERLLTEYLMPEIPWIIERWRRKEARRDLMSIQLNGLPYMEEGEREEFLTELRAAAFRTSALEEDNEFDAEGLLAARMRFGGRI